MKKATLLKKILFIVVFLISFNGYSQPCSKPETKITHPTCISNSGTIEFTYPLNVDATTNYQYSVDDGLTYQSSPIFTGLTPKYYKIRIKDLISGCETGSGQYFATVDNVQVVKVDDVGCTSGTGTIEFLAPLDIDATTNYEYSIDNGVTYQSSPVFAVLSAGNYNTKVRDLVNGCVTSTVVRTVKAAPVAPTSSPSVFCDGANSTSTAAAFDFNNVGQSSFVYSYSIDGGPTISHGLQLPSNIAVVGATQGQPVTFTIYWNNVCAPSQTITCYPKCVTPVIPTFNAVAAICKGESLSPLPTKSLNGVLGTWSPALNNTVTTTYTFTPIAAGECATNATMTIVVNPETVPIFNAVAPICMGDTLSALPTVSNNGINGTWSPAPNNTTTTTYTFTPSMGQCATTTTMSIPVYSKQNLIITNPNAVCAPNTVNITSASVTAGSTGGETLSYWTNASATSVLANPSAISVSGTYFIKSTDGTCYDIKPVKVSINPSPVATVPSVYELCDSTGVTDTESFDLTTKIPQILGAYSPVTHKVDFYNNLDDAHLGNSANSITNVANYISGSKSIYGRLEIIATGCYDVVILSLKVNPLPNVEQPLAPIFACDADNDGYAFFNLGNPTLTNSILGTNQSPSNFTVSFYETSSGANPLTNVGEQSLPLSNYQNITTSVQKVYIRVVNNLTGCVNPTGELSLNVEPSTSASGPQIYSACDSYNNPADGVALINLTQFETAILNGQNPSKFLLSYYNNQADALANKNPISLALTTKSYITKPNTDKVWVKIVNSNAPDCYSITTIDINIINSPNPLITSPNNINTICVDFNTNVVKRALTLQSGITNPSSFNFEWYEDNSVTPIPGANGPTYTVSTATGLTRKYKVRVTSKNPPYCSTTSLPLEVFQSGSANPLGTGYTVTEAFSENNTITVKVEGHGTYEYSLDDGPRQASNVFENVNAGEHTVYVWDVKGGEATGCPELVITNIRVIDYPKYFTPNGDGFNDTWNIVLDSQLEAVIYIFDRYGKLLKQVFPLEPGWDGTYNGRMMPSNDYWFTLEYAEGGITKNFKSHFSLLR